MKNLFVLAEVVLIIILVTGCTKEKQTIPVLTTAAVSEVSYTTATSGGDIKSNGGASIISSGICWNISSSPTTGNNKTVETGTGTFVSKITQLTQNTKYYVRAYAVNSIGTGYGEEQSFTTIQASIPLLTTTDISSISFRTAVSGGVITDDKGEAVVSRGVCWNTVANPTVADSKTDNGSGKGTFISNLTGLIPNTTYYLRGYATNLVGTAYGLQLSFKTRQISTPTLTTELISSVTQKSAISGGNITDDNGEAVTARGICWSVTGNPTITDSKSTDGTGSGNFISSLTGLTPNTTYYARAYATNSLGVAYGNQIIFNTDAISGTLNNGLIAYYPFNGNAEDRSGNNNNGVISGATLSSDIFGHPKCAYYFNGLNNYISLKPADNFVGLNNYSISLWVKPTVITTNGGGVIYGLGSSSYGPVHGLTYQSSATLFSGSYNVGTNPIQSYSKSCCYNPNNWIYVVVTRDNSIINLYIDGILIPSQATSMINGQNADYGSSPFAAILGGRSSLDSQNFFTGVIDEVRVYNRVLSENEITTLKSLNQ
jgi:hypothetical protein